MLWLMLFALGMGMGVAVSPWCFFICLIPMAAIILYAWMETQSATNFYTRPRKARSRGRPKTK
jgi:hypothetical protein